MGGGEFTTGNVIALSMGFFNNTRPGKASWPSPVSVLRFNRWVLLLLIIQGGDGKICLDPFHFRFLTLGKGSFPKTTPFGPQSPPYHQTTKEYYDFCFLSKNTTWLLTEEGPIKIVKGGDDGDHTGRGMAYTLGCLATTGMYWRLPPLLETPFLLSLRPKSQQITL